MSRLSRKAVTVWLDGEDAVGLARVASAFGTDGRGLLERIVSAVVDDQDAVPVVLSVSREAWADLRQFALALIEADTATPDDGEPLDMDLETTLHLQGIVNIAVANARRAGRL